MKEQIEQLKKLEAASNGGRGMPCVKAVIKRLEEGNMEVAYWYWRLESDKLLVPVYADMQAILKNIFKDFKSKQG